MPRLNLMARPQPFIGLLLAAGGWALSHQVGSDNAFDSCTTGGPVTVIASLIGLAICAVGGFYGRMSYRKAEGSGRLFMAVLAMLLALIAAFAIVLQVCAGLILPPCAA